MLHLQPVPATDLRPAPYAEAVSRLATVRHALRLVDGLGDGPEPDSDHAIAAAWDRASAGRQRCFDRRSTALVGAAAAGLEALLIERDGEREPHQAATDALVAEIRRQLFEISSVILG